MGNNTVTIYNTEEIKRKLQGYSIRLIEDEEVITDVWDCDEVVDSVNENQHFISGKDNLHQPYHQYIIVFVAIAMLQRKIKDRYCE